MSGMNKSERLTEMKRLYIQRAYSDIDMAKRLGVARETVYRDRIELTAEYPIEPDNEGRYRIVRSKLISEIKVNLHEALTLYLAARKTSRQTRFHHPHAASALEKLAAVLRQPMTERLLKTADRLLQQEKEPERIKIIETVTQAWVEEKKVRIRYQGLKSAGVTNHVISPYFIEPSVWSDSVYVMAYSDTFEKVMPFKIDRIDSAVISGEDIKVLEGFDDEDLLRHAWGIWYGEGEPDRVVLKFAPGEATRRLKESKWHPLEKVVDTEDGGCIWSAEVAEWREMLPWVRGWGADVEVLEPKELREALTREAQELAELYRVVEAQARPMIYYAHTKDGKDESEWQKLIDHLTRVADYAAEFGSDAGISELARIAGSIHDLGKYSKEFQARLRGSKRKVDHATAGAKELTQLFKGTPQESLAMLLAYCISGHHTGLLDYGGSSDLPGDGTLLARLKTDVCDYSAYKTELDLATLPFPQQLGMRPLKGQMGFSFAFLTRMIYSALVDADFQETQEFMDEKKPRGEHESIEVLCKKVNEYVRRFDNPNSEINRMRTETLRACIDKATEKPGFFKLTVPTGGGKTETSLAFALNHAVKYGLKRVIYVIPFTTIIEQNAGKFKKILGEENVLEHHSNFDWEKEKRKAEEADDQTVTVYSKLKLAAENWDIPIVVTTNVQFFESLFANKYSRCRKLHNIAKSVIVFDEAQMFPKDYMLPAMSAVWELVTNYGASAVFCTATQPKLETFLPDKTEIRELAPNPSALFDFYKRVEIKNAGKLTDDELIARLNKDKQALCIVNTRKHASGLFQKLEGEGNYHLSTLMCPVHRRQKLEEIRERLGDGRVCRVVSTSVMEAGIDVDFPVGYRALTGLDSINQAAGRVNREMKRSGSQMFIFEPDSELSKNTIRYLVQGVEVTRGVLRDHGGAPISIPAIDAYFARLYSLKEPRDFDYKNIMGCFDNNQPKYKFATVAENFRVIEDVTQTVIIPFNKEALKLIEELKHTPYPSSTLRKLQPYTVSIFEGEFDKLSAKGVILTIDDAYQVLKPEYFADYYDLSRGLLIPDSVGGDGIIA
ncbi:MAG: CRISPR-associated helicase Cas3' [Chloroflexi bacterium]|nr:CRISPR-associated helicase Cas3' [Chloroflexota bacterium]